MTRFRVDDLLGVAWSTEYLSWWGPELERWGGLGCQAAQSYQVHNGEARGVGVLGEVDGHVQEEVGLIGGGNDRGASGGRLAGGDGKSGISGI